MKASSTPLVFAAASLKNVLDEISEIFPMRLSYGGSGALSRQVMLGAPADLIITANPKWMEVLAKEALLEGSPVDLLSNRLVLIASANAGAVDIASIVASGRIAVGFVEAVPAGQYAKAAFETLGLWQELQGQLVQTENVRAALALVSRGEVPWGVVYETDALADPNVEIVAQFDPQAHPKILYQAGMIKGADRSKTLDALQSIEAAEVYQKHGFRLL